MIISRMSERSGRRPFSLPNLPGFLAGRHEGPSQRQGTALAVPYRPQNYPASAAEGYF